MPPTRTEFLETGLVPVTDTATLADQECYCLEEYTDPVSLPCGHIFCRECITHWLEMNMKNTCPKDRRVLFALDVTEQPEIGEVINNLPADRETAVAQALVNSGLTGNSWNQYTYDAEFSEFLRLRAIPQASDWLTQSPRPEAIGPAILNKRRLGVHIVVMGNLLRGYAQAMNRPYNLRQIRDWRLIIIALYDAVAEANGYRADCTTLVQELRRNIERNLAGVDVFLARFFDSEVAVESFGEDVRTLIAYVVQRSVDEFQRREQESRDIREAKGFRKVGKWVQRLVRD